MPWFFTERRGPEWKQGWAEQTIASLSLPPPRLIAVFCIVVLLLSLSWHMDYKTQLRRTENNLKFGLFILVPVALAVAGMWLFRDGRFVYRLPWAETETGNWSGASPCGVAALVLLLLVMLSYQSSFHSQWFHGTWRD